MARRYNEQGADEITFLDITASHEDRDTTLHTVERMAGEVFIPLTVGGGVRELSDIRNLLNAGADKVRSAPAAKKDFMIIVTSMNSDLYLSLQLLYAAIKQKKTPAAKRGTEI